MARSKDVEKSSETAKPTPAKKSVVSKPVTCKDGNKKGASISENASVSPALIAAISSFLTTYGFDKTSKAFTAERKAKKSLMKAGDKSNDKGTTNKPFLVKIFERWELIRNAQHSVEKEGTLRCGDRDKSDTSDSESDSNFTESSDSDVVMEGARAPSSVLSLSSSSCSSSASESSDEDVKKAPITQLSNQKRKHDDSSSSSCDSDSDEAHPEVKRTKLTTEKPTLNSLAKSSSTLESSSESFSGSDTGSDSSSDFDCDSTSDSNSSSSTSASVKSKLIPITKSAEAATIAAQIPLPGSVKKGFGDSSPSSSSPFSGSSSDTDNSSSCRQLADSNATHKNSSSSSNSSSDSSSNSSSSDSSVSKKRRKEQSSNQSNKSATSSAILKKAASITSTFNIVSARGSNPAASTPSIKHSGTQPTPLALAGQLSHDHPSNAYIPYAYAERAYKDLSVTRGKGFTKEKNKKKRGSYRGGLIDIGPGKSFKFED
ncbi:hypothetical protein I7I51_05719 [Histoplasma capsulatum]|uniref:Srp40 C-terminal domain-containing protein n=1 Tax=Ajellomyces capsulatus TaxID=5037 RepID=A0A8A1M8H4_AJECA|nr:predicted protein [Histoplasma mississippiense (nom. inval.)]EDN06980.1 predicted protein [Histoplasma mississippiense (nom. inval.)]QSS60914.1 hypothetical protein I7I51_05719 [Histoplasma capsulatum]